MPGEALFMKLVFGYASVGTILIFGASDFPYFFNMAARRNHTRTSSYRAIVGLTKRSPVIQTQTLSLDNIKYYGSGKCSLNDL